MKMTARFHRSCAGQAMIEMMIGIILILMLLVGSVQFLLVSDAHTCIDSSIRGRAGRLAMLPRGLEGEDIPRYFTTWNAGADDQRFTADDYVPQGNIRAPNAIQLIASRSVRDDVQWGEFDDLRNPSSLEALHNAPVPLISIGFVGLRHSTTVEVDPFARELFYPNEFVTVREDVWVPIMNGLY